MNQVIHNSICKDYTKRLSATFGVKEKLITREFVVQAIEEFLKNGGKIQIIAPGEIPDSCAIHKPKFTATYISLHEERTDKLSWGY